MLNSNYSSQTVQRSNHRIFMLCMGFGISAGVIFPLYAHFVIGWKAESQLWFLLGCGAGGLMLGYANYWIFNSLLLKNLNHVANVVDRVGAGDLSARCKVEDNDVAAGVAYSVNEMAKRWNAVIGELSDSTRLVSHAVNTMTSITDETSISIQQQQSETDQAATAMNQMSETVKDVARNAEAAATAARDADAAAKNGSQVAAKAMGGIQALTGEVQKASNVIQKLEQDSQSIGVILEVIQGIAEQTNLLALNAAIEAARAGEQGRGFAVVADEVRTLASRTQQSTEEIKRMIEQLQSGAGDAVKVMEVAREKAQVGEDSVQQAVDALATIGGAVATIDEMNTQIANAAHEQGTVAEEINQNLVGISQGAEKATSGAQLSKKSGNELAGLVSKLADVVARFKRG